MDEHKVLKERLNKLNQLLDKLDERLATGEIGEAKYKELAEKYKAEAENLKNQIAEKELLHEVGLKAEGKREEEPVKEGYGDNEDTLVYNLRRLLTEGGTGNYLVVSVGEVYVQFAASRGEQQIYCEAVSNQFLPPSMRLNEDRISQMRSLGFEIGRGSPNFSRTFYIVDSQELREIARTGLSVLSDVYGIPSSSMIQFELNLESGGRAYGTPAQPVYQERKNAVLAAVLSFIISGLGQIYCGRVKRGAAILVIAFLLFLFFVAVAGSVSDDPYADRNAPFIPFFMWLFFWLWNISDAYKLAENINRGIA